VETLEKWLQKDLMGVSVPIQKVVEKGKFFTGRKCARVRDVADFCTNFFFSSQIFPVTFFHRIDQFPNLFLGTFRPVTDHAIAKLDQNIEKAGGVLPNSTVLLYPLNGPATMENLNELTFRCVDGNTRLEVFSKR
jgi:hypothetical protein